MSRGAALLAGFLLLAVTAVALGLNLALGERLARVCPIGGTSWFSGCVLSPHLAPPSLIHPDERKKSTGLDRRASEAIMLVDDRREQGAAHRWVIVDV